MIHDQYQKLVNLTPPAAIVNNASLTVAALDTLGWDYAQIDVILGATDIALTALKLTESDDNSSYTDVPLSIYGTSNNSGGSASTLPAATDDNGIFGWHVQLTGQRKRYLKAVVTIGNGSTGAFANVLGILSRAQQAPNTMAKRGFVQDMILL